MGRRQEVSYLRSAIDLSRKSFDAGEFPAGAVLVTKSGKVYESEPSLLYYHSESMVIDKAIQAEGAPLAGATIYASMEPCLMCSAKMYWAGVTNVEYVIPKEKTNTRYAYEDDKPMAEHLAGFNTPIHLKHDAELLDEALELYSDWVKKIEAK
jgi:tRNA(Arg) A34 adenosine deaminase TadA